MATTRIDGWVSLQDEQISKDWTGQQPLPHRLWPTSIGEDIKWLKQPVRAVLLISDSDQPPAEMVWIPVSERLPTEYGTQKVAFLYHPEWALFRDGVETHRVSACAADNLCYDVTHRTDGTTPFASHWMPLPSAPTS